jgi:ankyrin repeat protein
MSEVITAAMDGKIELVKELVLADAGCVLKADSEYVCFFRARAAAAYDFQTARALQLRSIFLISVISGFTALINSSRYGHHETTRFLVESGANVAAKDRRYYTPCK